MIGSVDVQQALKSWPQWATQEPLLSAEIGGGRSNQSYLLSENNTARFVLRINQNNSQQLGINRLQETAIAKVVSAQGISPELVYNDPNERFIVYRYIHGINLSTLTGKQAPDISNLANLLQDIHATKLPGDTSQLNLIEYCDQYWQTLNSAHKAIEHLRLTSLHKNMGEVFKQLRQSLSYASANCLCHNDLIPENIIQHNGNAQLFAIDWEYASMGNRHFDLACICETHSFSQQQEIKFLTLYHDSAPPQPLNHQYSLQPYRLIYRYIELLWLAHELARPGKNARLQASKKQMTGSLQHELNQCSNNLEQRLSSYLN